METADAEAQFRHSVQGIASGLAAGWTVPPDVHGELHCRDTQFEAPGYGPVSPVSGAHTSQGAMPGSASAFTAASRSMNARDV